MNFADIPQAILGEKKDGELSVKERKIAERIVLEMYCQYDPSLPFREIISPEVSSTYIQKRINHVNYIIFYKQNTEYHAIIKNPIALDTIRQKLNWGSDDHYKNLEELVRDVRRMFKNAYTFNAVILNIKCLY